MLRPCLALALVAAPVFAFAEDDKPVVVFSEAGKFSVTMPEKPKRQVQKVPSAAGNIETVLFVVDRKDRGFVASYADYPKGTVTEDNLQKVLDGVTDGNVKGAKGKLISEEKVTLGKKKYEGREVLIAFPNNGPTYRSRNFIINDRLYQIVVLGPKDFTTGKDADAYLDSFTIEE